MDSKHVLLATVAIATLLLIGAIAVQAKPNGLKPGIDFSGPHFNLIVHGVPEGVDKFENDSIGSGRHTIFVPISTPENITILYAFFYMHSSICILIHLELDSA
jgi:hypothetical protein